ncbi:MAG: MFS transporter [Peptococcaceae bacterium]|nr:MFS transporter [Peptococcaceae bacterium]
MSVEPGAGQSYEKKFLGMGWGGWVVTLTSFLGWTLVNVDASFFSFVYPLIQKDLHLPDWAIGAIVSSMAIAAMIATLIVGPLMDYLGRRKIFQWTILFTVIGSALSALATGFTSLLIARCVCMAGATSEWVTGQTMVTEGTPKNVRGWWTGFAQIGWPVGWFLSTWIVISLVPLWGWRGVFWAGLVPIILLLWVRVLVKESPRFEDIAMLRKKSREVAQKRHETLESAAAQVETKFKVKKDEAVQFTYKQLFNSDLRKRTILFWIWMFVYNYGLFAVAYFLPSIAEQHGFTLGDSWIINAWGTGIGAIGYLVAAFFGERFGRRNVAILWLLIGGIFGTLFGFCSYTWHFMALWWALYYFFTVGHMGVFAAYVLENYPTRARGTGGSFASFSVWVSLLLAGLTSQAFVSIFGVEVATFIWLGVASWIACACALGTPKVKPGLELEEIAV